MFPLQFCLPKLKWKHTTFHICHSEVGALRVSEAEDSHLVIAMLTRKRRRQNRYRLSLWITGSLGKQKTEHMTDFQYSSCEIAGAKASGVTRCRQRCDAPVSCKGSDGRWGTGESSSSQISSPALLPSVTLSRMVRTARLCLKHLPRARARATERSNVLFFLCTDLRGPSKDFLEQQSGITLESRSPLLAWLVEHCSNLLLLFHKGEPHDGHTTQPTCV